MMRKILNTLHTIYPFLKDNEIKKMSIFYLLLSLLVTGLSNFSTPFFMKFIFDKIQKNQYNNLLIILIGWIICCLWLIFGRFSITVFNEKTFIKIRNKINNEYLDKFERLTYEKITKFENGDIVERLTNDVKLLLLNYLKILDICAKLVILATISIYWGLISVETTSVTFAISFLSMWIDSCFGKTLFKRNKKLLELNSILNQNNYDSVLKSELLVGEGIYNQYIQSNIKLKNKILNIEKTSVYLSNVNISITKTLDILAYISLIIVFYYKGPDISIGIIMASLTYYGAMKSYLDKVRSSLINIYTQNSTVDRLNEIHGNDNNKIDDIDLYSDTILSFENVVYQVDNKSILRSISFDIKKFEKVAIVGPNGSGKTTLLRLILGLYTPSEGNISICNYNYSDLTNNVKKEIFTYIPANTQLFPISIYNNFTLATDDLNIIDENLNVNWMSDFLKSLPNSYHTILNESESSFSGGQVQRIAVMRALLASGKILIADEPTSNLDKNTATSVFESILGFKGTLIFVTHRPELARLADRIIYMEGGRIETIGKYETVKENELFKKWESTENDMINAATGV